MAMPSSFEHEQELPHNKLLVHTGGTRRKAGASRESSPPALPSLLSLLLHLLLFPPPPLSSYIPGALFFAGKHSLTTGGGVELFSGINGNSTESKLPECSYLLSAPSQLRLCCLCRYSEIPTEEFKRNLTKYLIQ